MLNVIKASLVGSALMLLASCTGYLTNYQTPCVQGHVCECVQYTTVYRSWLDCRDYGRVEIKVAVKHVHALEAGQAIVGNVECRGRI